MGKSTLNKQLLNEELKKYRLLSEYSFYVGEDDQYDKDAENLILGEVGEDGEEDAPIENPDDEQSMDPNDNTPPPVPGDMPQDTYQGNDFDQDMGDEEPVDDMSLAPEEEESDEVELDVTQLVQGTDEAKASADAATNKMEDLLIKFGEMQSQLANMENISKKIDNLETQIEKRNPTPVEKLEMRSFDSYPYNLKLTDYWSEKEGAYNMLDKGNEEEEYTLTQNDIDSEYNEPQIKSSFDEDGTYNDLNKFNFR